MLKMVINENAHTRTDCNAPEALRVDIRPESVTLSRAFLCMGGLVWSRETPLSA